MFGQLYIGSEGRQELEHRASWPVFTKRELPMRCRSPIAGLIYLLVFLACAVSGTALVGAAGKGASQATLEKGGVPMSLTITSSAFSQNGEIPAKCTCDGKDVS